MRCAGFQRAAMAYDNMGTGTVFAYDAKADASPPRAETDMNDTGWTSGIPPGQGKSPAAASSLAAGVATTAQTM